MKKFLTLMAIAATAISPLTHSSEVITLGWLDLVPKQEQEIIKKASQPFSSDHSAEMPQQNKLGSVREDLNDKQVKIPGFIIPLEGDDEMVTEFLLVPYFGACIHVPPPPTNQIIYVKTAKGTPNQKLWDVVYITGTMHTQDTTTLIAETGYSMTEVEISSYK